MTRKYHIVIFLWSTISFGLTSKVHADNARDTLQLFDCYQYAVQHHPLAKQVELYEKGEKLRIKNHNTHWYPQIDLNAQATYQSDVPHIGDISLPAPSGQPGSPSTYEIDIPEPDHDQYKIALDIRQTIYDGGATKKSKTLETINAKANRQNVRVEIEKVKSQINEVYFSILLLDKHLDQINLVKDEIEKRTKSIASGVENGTLLPSDLKVVEAELLSIKQQRFELKQKKESLVNILSELTDTTIGFNAILIPPDVSFEQPAQINRQELILFDIQKESLQASKDLTLSKQMPNVFAFSQVGYGKPGLNMLNDEFDTYYLIGAGLKWNLWDWKQHKRQRQLLDIKQSVVETQKQHFKQNIEIALQREIEKIVNLESMIKTDLKIIEKREEIIESARSQLENGIINSTEFLTKLNQKKEANIRLETHKIELTKAKINYLTMNGDL